VAESGSARAGTFSLTRSRVAVAGSRVAVAGSHLAVAGSRVAVAGTPQKEDRVDTQHGHALWTAELT
jgi:rRNA processing protein Krr1/Pno1